MDPVYIHPVGMRTATDLFFCDKSANMKHPSAGHFLDLLLIIHGELIEPPVVVGLQDISGHNGGQVATGID